MKRKRKLTPHQKWLQVLNGAHAQRKHKQWSLGDALNEAKQKWSKHWGRKQDLWQQAADASGHTVASLMQYARVAGVFPFKQRRYKLPFSIFQTIAGIANERKRISLVRKAAREKLSSERVRLLVQKIQNRQTAAKKKLTIEITVDAYSKLRDAAILQNTTVRKLAVRLLSNPR